MSMRQVDQWTRYHFDLGNVLILFGLQFPYHFSVKLHAYRNSTVHYGFMYAYIYLPEFRY